MTIFGRKITRAPVAILAALILLGTTTAVPTTVKAGVWSSWQTKYIAASTNECNVSKFLAWKWNSTHYGPINYYGVGCMRRIRMRRMFLDTTPWADRLLQIENTAAIWPAWGMNLTVRVHWNGTIAKYDEASLWCNNWSFLIKVTPIQCKVWDSGTSSMLVRMAYDASFIQQGFVFSVQRGAEVFVFGTGVGNVRTWP